MAHQFENKRQLAQITLFRAFGATKVSDQVLTALAAGYRIYNRLTIKPIQNETKNLRCELVLAGAMGSTWTWHFAPRSTTIQ